MGSTFGVTWEDPEGGFIKFAIKRALKQDQTLHMEEKLQFIHYFSREWVIYIIIPDKWAVPYWMYPSEHFPMSISGTGYMFPVSIAECLIKSATKVPFLILEDVYVTGLLSKLCDVSLKNSAQFEYMGIGDDRGSAEKLLKLVLTHRANMTEMMELYINAWRYKGLEDLWTS